MLWTPIDMRLLAMPIRPRAKNLAGLTGLKTFLADGDLRIGSLKYDKYQISNLKAGLKSDGQKLSLNPLIAKVDDSQINANLSVSQFNNPAYNFDIKIDRLDADRYITKSDQQKQRRHTD